MVLESKRRDRKRGKNNYRKVGNIKIWIREVLKDRF